MVYTLHWKDGTTLAENSSTGSADIVKEILSWTKSQCLSFPALIWLLKGHTFFTTVQTDSFMSTVQSWHDARRGYSPNRSLGCCASLTSSAHLFLSLPLPLPFRITRYHPLLTSFRFFCWIRPSYRLN